MLQYSLDDLVGVRDGVEVRGGVDEPEEVGLQQVGGRVVGGEGPPRRAHNPATANGSVGVCPE